MHLAGKHIKLHHDTPHRLLKGSVADFCIVLIISTTYYIKKLYNITRNFVLENFPVCNLCCF
jgi:hypothetical protein